MGTFYNQQWQTQRRGDLRNNQTEAEWLLWLELKGGQLGHKFRRQFGVGPYILDFYCPEFRLGVEVDGEGHFTSEGVSYDSERSDFLAGRGIHILRFTNQEVHQKLDHVLHVIKLALLESASP